MGCVAGRRTCDLTTQLRPAAEERCCHFGAQPVLSTLTPLIAGFIVDAHGLANVFFSLQPC